MLDKRAWALQSFAVIYFLKVWLFWGTCVSVSLCHFHSGNTGTLQRFSCSWRLQDFRPKASEWFLTLLISCPASLACFSCAMLLTCLLLQAFLRWTREISRRHTQWSPWVSEWRRLPRSNMVESTHAHTCVVSMSQQGFLAWNHPAGIQEDKGGERH